MSINSNRQSNHEFPKSLCRLQQRVPWTPPPPPLLPVAHIKSSPINQPTLHPPPKKNKNVTSAPGARRRRRARPRVRTHTRTPALRAPPWRHRRRRRPPPRRSPSPSLLPPRRADCRRRRGHGTGPPRPPSSAPPPPPRHPPPPRRPSLRGASPSSSPARLPPAAPTHVASLARDRAEDLQAESRAMTRAAAATVFSPELLSSRYGSRPVKANPPILTAPLCARRLFGTRILTILAAVCFTRWRCERRRWCPRSARLG